MTPVTEIVVGGSRQSAKLQAIIDTGFDGEVCIPVSLAVTLGLELVGAEFVEYGDGSRKQELLFAGSAVLQGAKRDVEIFLTNGEDALIGTDLLEDCLLTIDFPKKRVKLTAKGRGR